MYCGLFGYFCVPLTLLPDLSLHLLPDFVLQRERGRRFLLESQAFESQTIQMKSTQVRRYAGLGGEVI